MLFVLTFAVNAAARASSTGARSSHDRDDAAAHRWRASSGSGCARLKDRAGHRADLRLPSRVALIPLVWLLWTVVSQGLARRSPRNGWFTQSQRGITYRDPGGGALPRDRRHRWSRSRCARSSRCRSRCWWRSTWSSTAAARWPGLTTFMVDILTGIPSIVAALFIYAVFVTTFGGQRAGWLVSLALVC